MLTGTAALITAPDQEVVTIAEAKAQLRIDSINEDAFLQDVIGAAVHHLDPAGLGWLGRALRPQTWELRLPCFPVVSRHSLFAEILLPYPPLIAVTSVKYDDAAGVEQILILDTDYQISGAGGSQIAALVPAYGKSWPAARHAPESVRVRYQCGYETGSPDTLPLGLKRAVLLLAAHWFKNREPVLTGAIATPLPFTVDALLAPYRVYGP